MLVNMLSLLFTLLMIKEQNSYTYKQYGQGWNLC